MSQKSNKQELLGAQLGAAIQKACSASYGELSSGFLCRSLGSLNPPHPLSVREDASLKDVIAILKKNKIGSVIVTDAQGKLSGIFTERDCVLKILDSGIDLEKTRIAEVMTKDPVSESPESTIAYALNLMSHGGFRHIPIVDQDRMPVGVLSVKDLVDYLVATMTEDLLGLEVEE